MKGEIRRAEEQERVFLPGRPISMEAWNRFMESKNWLDAPLIFGSWRSERAGGLVAAESGRRMELSGPATRAYFSALIDSDGRIFADEIDKNNLLRFLSVEAVRWQVPIADFVMTDDSLHLVICKEARKGMNTSLQRWYEYALAQFISCLKRRYVEYYVDRNNLHCPYAMGNSLQRYQNPAGALEECCRIHTLPLEQGYVDDIRKYWFSGYLTMRGKFAWNFMDPTGLLRDLGRKPATAIRHYEAAHRAYILRRQSQTNSQTEDCTVPLIL